MDSTNRRQGGHHPIPESARRGVNFFTTSKLKKTETNMKRREFLKTSLLSGAAMAVAPMQLLTGCTDNSKKEEAPAPVPDLKRSFQ